MKIHPLFRDLVDTAILGGARLRKEDGTEVWVNKPTPEERYRVHTLWEKAGCPVVEELTAVCIEHDCATCAQKAMDMTVPVLSAKNEELAAARETIKELKAAHRHMGAWQHEAGPCVICTKINSEIRNDALEEAAKLVEGRSPWDTTLKIIYDGIRSLKR